MLTELFGWGCGDTTTTITFVLDTPVANGEVVTIEYNATGDAADSVGNLVKAFTAKTVTNNVQ